MVASLTASSLIREGRQAAVSDQRKSFAEHALLTPKQTAEFLGVHPKTLPTLIRRDGLPCSWVGRRRRFDNNEVSRWLSAQKEG